MTGSVQVRLVMIMTGLFAFKYSRFLLMAYGGEVLGPDLQRFLKLNSC